MKIDIEVTHEDIMQGQRKNCFACPVALAIKKNLLFSDVVVSRSTVDLYINGSRLYRSCSLPSAVGDRIVAFDSEQGMEPFVFQLEIPDGTSADHNQ